MNSKPSRRKPTLYALALPAALLTAGVFPTQCSTLSSLGAINPLPVQPAVIARSEPEYPDVPPQILRCLEERAKQGATADETVTNQLEVEKKKEACVAALKRWYAGVRSAKAKAVKTKGL